VRVVSRLGVPAASSDGALRRMKAARRRDTGPEIAIRRLLHAEGLRYRIDRSPVPGGRGRADIVFIRARVAVFIDGCFWHSCPLHGTRPKSNARWWATKLGENRRRDAQSSRELMGGGWKVIRVWEHEIPSTAAARIARAVRGRSP